jgi:hypothetical protein
MLYAAGMIPGDFVKKYNHHSGSYSHDGVSYPFFSNHINVQQQQHCCCYYLLCFCCTDKQVGCVDVSFGPLSLLLAFTL